MEFVLVALASFLSGIAVTYAVMQYRLEKELSEVSLRQQVWDLTRQVGELKQVSWRAQTNKPSA